MKEQMGCKVVFQTTSVESLCQNEWRAQKTSTRNATTQSSPHLTSPNPLAGALRGERNFLLFSAFTGVMGTLQQNERCAQKTSTPYALKHWQEEGSGVLKKRVHRARVLKKRTPGGCHPPLQSNLLSRLWRRAGRGNVWFNFSMNKTKWRITWQTIYG